MRPSKRDQFPKVVDLEPKPASLWSIDTCRSEEKEEMTLGTLKGCHKFLINGKFSTCGASSRDNVRFCGRTNALSKQRVEIKMSTFEGSCVKLSRGNRHKKCEMKLFRLNKRKDRMWVEYRARTCMMARTTWGQMGFPFLHEKIADSVWRALGWTTKSRMR